MWTGGGVDEGGEGHCQPGILNLSSCFACLPARPCPRPPLPTTPQYLRPHQREGVQFMFECVAGLREYEGQGEGCCCCRRPPVPLEMALACPGH